MRALKWTAVAAWLAFHAWLWTLLPPLPRWAVPGFVPHSLAFTLDGRSLVTCERDVVSVWDVATGRREHAWPKTAPPPTYDDSRALMVMSPTDRRAIVFDIKSGGRESPRLIDLDTGATTALPKWENLVPADDPCIGFLPDGRSAWQLDAVMKPTINNVLRVWDLPDGPPRTVVVRSRLYAEPSFSADGRRAALAPHTPNSPAGSVQLLDLAAGRVARDLVLDGRQAVIAMLSPDGRTVAVAAAPVVVGGAMSYPEAQLWDPETGRLVAALGAGSPLGWTADGLLIVNAGDEVRLFRAPDGIEVARSKLASRAGSYATLLVAGGRFLVCWDYRQLPDAIRRLLEWLPIRWVDLNQQTFVCTFRDVHTGWDVGAVGMDVPTAAAFAADGSALAAFDSTGLRVWDMPPRKPGGLVLGAMLVQVGLLTAWSAWRRRRRAAVGLSPGGA